MMLCAFEKEPFWIDVLTLASVLRDAIVKIFGWRVQSALQRVAWKPDDGIVAEEDRVVVRQTARARERNGQPTDIPCNWGCRGERG